MSAFAADGMRQIRVIYWSVITALVRAFEGVHIIM